MSRVASRNLDDAHRNWLGDTLLVLRYVPLLARQGARVILQMPPSLAELAACVPGVSEVALEGDALPAFDVQCPMMSLPLAFHTTLDTVPGEVPYLFTPDSARVVWAQRLGPATRRRIGLAWSGSVSQAHDQGARCHCPGCCRYSISMRIFTRCTRNTGRRRRA